MQVHLMEGAGDDAGLIEIVDWKDLPQIGAKVTFRYPQSIKRYEVISVEHVCDVGLVYAEPDDPCRTIQPVQKHVVICLMDLDRADFGGYRNSLRNRG